MNTITLRGQITDKPTPGAIVRLGVAVGGMVFRVEADGELGGWMVEHDQDFVHGAWVFVSGTITDAHELEIAAHHISVDASAEIGS